MRRGIYNVSFEISSKIIPPPEPHIFLDSLYFLDGDTFSLNCTVTKIMNYAVALEWEIPNPKAKLLPPKSNHYSGEETIYKNITVQKASKDDAGNYTCLSINGHNTVYATVQKIFLEEPKLEMKNQNKNSYISQNESKLVRAVVEVNDYPPAKIVFLKNGELIPGNSDRNITSCSNITTKGNVQYFEKRKCTILLRHVTLEDMGNYTVRATNKYLTNNFTYDIRVTAHPKIDFRDEIEKSFLLDTQASLFCKATGYPMPEIKWIFYPDHGKRDVIKTKYQTDTLTSLYSKESILTIPARTAGNISCHASNTNGSIESKKMKFIVYEILKGFGIKKEETWFPEKQYVELKCLGSIFDFENLTWYGPDGRDMENVEYTENALSYVAKLKMERISISQAGKYTCIGIKKKGTEENDTITIAVEGTKDPAIVDANGEGKDEVEVIPFQPVNFTCAANAVPPPTIEWYKDGLPVVNSTEVQILINNPEHSYRNSTLIIPEIHVEHVGKYECRASSLSKKDSRIYNLFLKENTQTKTYVSIIGAILLIMLGLIAILAWRIRKLKEFKRELAAAGLLNFKEGAAASINPDIGIDEQAELLPYNEKFEFPAECLKLGKQLGAGAFGVVYKAEARGIIDAEKTTTVAVKMVKKTADNMYIKALASELKIMVHLGKHVNIVNLLGACTKNVGKRELIVIVEYCKFGNIHNYMQKHREVFIDQFNDNPEKQMGRINRGYSSSSGNSGMHSDYYGSNHTQDTDHTLLNTANTNRSSRKQSETGYVQPEWRSNYESDYSFDGRSPRPLYTRDLIAWAFQIARGMEYLANRKVLHGDLAARNVLLADDNIVKICDFGLARSIYKNDEYQKQENSPLPVKWLAIECMTDRIFSTQSDVWSFGVVLWELFSLAKTPYPNVSLPGLLQWLHEGGRLEKPAYADDRIYAVMRNCWEEKPTKRPTFTELQTTLGSFLEDTVRNHYVDLDAAYMDMNTKKAGEEDYLAMVSAPDYNNLVTPSPHHYVNEGNFFPPTMNNLHHEDEGYLQMSPTTRQNLFNARVQGTKFDFDARKLTPRVSENSYGESTPMLDLNNLPRSGSESDQEGHSPPYHGTGCPRIDEEADEVFIENSKNTQPNSITNPTYITMSPGSEKKSHNFANNYINVKIPNGLVK